MIIFGPLWFVASVLLLRFIFKKPDKPPIVRATIKSKWDIIRDEIKLKEKLIDKLNVDIRRNKRLLKLANNIYLERSRNE